MGLIPVGGTSLEPETVFLWDSDSQAVIEVTFLRPGFLIRASKSYRLLKQGENGRESWQRNLNNMNDYLAENFSSFQISVDFSNSVVPEILDVQDQAASEASKAARLFEKKEQLDGQIEKLEKSLSISLDDFEGNIESRIADLRSEREEIDRDLDRILEELWQKNEVANQWQDNGVILAYCFTFSTDPQIAVEERELNLVIESLLNEVDSLHQRRIKQTLQGSNFQLFVEQIDQPRVFNRFEYSSLFDPENIEQLQNQTGNEAINNRLDDLKETIVSQYEAFTTRDIQVDGSTVEYSKSTPAEAVRSILNQLETQQTGVSTEYPNNGPFIGTIPGTQQVVGFDIFEHGPHYYIAGKTGTGKTHLKRVLVENAAAKGYDILSISPTKRDSIGLNLPNKASDNGQALSADQYWFGDDRLLDKPDDFTDLFTGINAVTLYGYDDRQKFINELFTELDEINLDTRALFVFLDESHRFNTGEAADAIQTIAQEGRSHGIRLVLVSQNPKSFQYNYKEVRNNTSFILFNRNYEIDIQQLVSNPDQLSSLKKGESVFADFLELPEMRVEVRNTLTRLWDGEPSDKEIGQVDQRFSRQIPDLPHSSEPEPSETPVKNRGYSLSLSDEERKVVEAIQLYIRENDKRPSKNKVIETGPFGTQRTSRILEDLVDSDVIKQGTEERYGNQAMVYSIQSSKLIK
jgi:uncharacterized protein YdcH (DUF465 family)